MGGPARPHHVLVVGAGAVGLSCAWFLQEHGADVTVLDRSGVGAGASWGNAGYLTPAMAVPLPEPALLREGLRSLATPGSPVAVTGRPSAATLAFLSGFVRNATAARWRRGMAALAPLCLGALPAFDELAAGGVAVQTHESSIRVGFRPGDDPAGLEHELAAARATGQRVEWTLTDGAEHPFSSRVERVLRLDGQRYLSPDRFLDALADAVRARGGEIVDGARARAVRPGPGGLQVDTGIGGTRRADAVVLATGAWLPELARGLGVRVPVQAGRGYSCSVRFAAPVTTPLYLPGTRVAITPWGDRARVAGTMEIGDRDAPVDHRRLARILRSVRPLLDGVDWDDVRDPWVGPRPLTPDGLPLIGSTALAGVSVAGGHGMWGVTLGPVTGKLLAGQVMTGAAAPELAPFSPLRSPWGGAVPR